MIFLNASRNIIRKIEFLSEHGILTFLETLNLSHNKIKYLTPIVLPSLRKLNLNDNWIENCDAFKGHYKLEVLELRKNKVSI